MGAWETLEGGASASPRGGSPSAGSLRWIGLIRPASGAEENAGPVGAEMHGPAGRWGRFRRWSPLGSALGRSETKRSGPGAVGGVAGVAEGESGPGLAWAWAEGRRFGSGTQRSECSRGGRAGGRTAGPGCGGEAAGFQVRSGAGAGMGQGWGRAAAGTGPGRGGMPWRGRAAALRQPGGGPACRAGAGLGGAGLGGAGRGWADESWAGRRWPWRWPEPGRSGVDGYLGGRLP